MRWLNGWCSSLLYGKLVNVASKSDSTWYHIPNIGYLDQVSQRSWLSTLGRASLGSLVHSIDQRVPIGCPQNVLQNPSTLCRQFGQSAGREDSLSRNWLVQLWRTDEREKNHGRRRRQGQCFYVQKNNPMFNSQTYAHFIRSILSRAGLDGKETQAKTTVEQPPMSQSAGGLFPNTPGEVRLAPLLARANLIITRDIEWANIMFAFEQVFTIFLNQSKRSLSRHLNNVGLRRRWMYILKHLENRYAIMDACYPQTPVGFIREKSNVIFRQLLRTRRPFIAYIIDAMGNEIFRVRRPFWLINSTIYAEVDGKEVGVVHSRWHLWKRIYDLYVGNKQFAIVENPGLWNWTFTLKDDDDNVLAQIDRDWRGLGLELFTDAGQYVIRFGDADSSPKSDLASAIQLEVARPLTLSERAVAVALAISLDNDYFSRQRGWGLPILVAGE